MPSFFAIAAMSENRVIGDQGKIPWHIPDDFRWFKRRTMGGTLVMGRKTFESIGKPLPGRTTVVLTHNRAIPGVDTCANLAIFDTEYLKAHEGQNFWVCGGGTIYEQMLDRCAYLYLTVVKKEVAGDTFFPGHYSRTHVLDQVIYETVEFRVERWRLINLPAELALPSEAWPL